MLVVACHRNRGGDFCLGWATRMLDDLKAQFLPTFVAETHTRLRTAMSLIPPAGPGGSANASRIVAMMESITGEAMHIGAPELALLARAAGGAARRYLETSND